MAGSPGRAQLARSQVSLKLPPDGASVMTSAEEFAAPFWVLLTVCFQPWVMSYSTRV